jgi:Xaa-Pro dipeptidase
MRVAAGRAAAGFESALEVFAAGGSERELYWAFLEGSDQVAADLPFSAIVALDHKSAILHYQHQRGAEAAPGTTFLLDAGAGCDGWASDLTRTWARDGAHPLFQQLLAGMDALERRLVAMVAPGRPYGEIHVAAHEGVAELLVETGIARCSAEACLADGFTRTFLPHGVGHHLGIQVHDVGGHMASPAGDKAPPPALYPSLRNTRVLAPGHVVTIEPGFYFIPMLLDPLRRDHAQHFDWALIDALVPCGGIRIEDDVLCTTDGHQDLSRPLLAGPRDTSVAAVAG